MQHRERAAQGKTHALVSRRLRLWPRTAGLQGRTTLSYIWVTAILVLVLEVLAMIGLMYVLLSIVTPFTYTLEARQSAQHYALAAALQASATALNPESAFQDGQPGTLTLPLKAGSTDDFHIPYIPDQTSNPHPLAFALLIAPNGRVLASSDPHRYPLNAPVSSIMPDQLPLVSGALIGQENSGQDQASGNSVYAVEPVWSRSMHPIGAVYVWITNLPSLQNISVLFPALLHIMWVSGLVLLLILTPISVFFGVMTMRGLVRRVHLLVAATARFAGGDYEQRVLVARGDEIGQLEQHFNLMAQQLAESRLQQDVLTRQNARLAERSRMSRDLHDGIKQQVFALAAQISTARALLDTKREETRSHLAIADELAYRIRQELTSLIHELRPSMPVEQGFTQALRVYVDQWLRQTDITADIQLQEVPPLSSMATEGLLLMVQEALSNVARHSQATHMQISLVREQAQIVLTIADNGRGFERTAVSPQSLGLQSMQERLEELGGSFSLFSSRGQGTRIVARCPDAVSPQEKVEEQ